MVLVKGGITSSVPRAQFPWKHQGALGLGSDPAGSQLARLGEDIGS